MLPCKIKQKITWRSAKARSPFYYEATQRSAAKIASTYGLISSAIFCYVRTPIAWGVLGYGAYRIGKSMYQKSKQNAKLNSDHHDLFV